MDVFARSEFEKLDGLNRWEHVERLRRERDYFRALAQSWGDEKDRLTADHREAIGALREIMALEEREGDLGEGPGYWGAIGECADIARRGLGGQ
jgi:hypothetical protein